uniref:ZP domain-containing protein n=1 Tax=Panagrolaimus sp. PS1159 TaxID=55785 RepID=A0AC35FRJ4_9BILA
MENMLERQITVDMPPPPLQTQQVPMPVCRYEVLDGTPEGPPVFYATIGQMVYHKWTCDAQTENQFCMKVHSCTVDDGNGDKVELINNEGCAHDKYLLQNLDYVSDLMVGKEAHVYKYADKQSMFFDCQITLTVKEPDQQFCDVPNCPDPPRRRREDEQNKALSLIDVTKDSPEKGVTELQAEFIMGPQKTQQSSWINDNFAFTEENVCMSKTGIGLIAFINIFFMSISGVLFWIAFCTFKAS